MKGFLLVPFEIRKNQRTHIFFFNVFRHLESNCDKKKKKSIVMLINNPFQKTNTYLVAIQNQTGWTPTIIDKSSIELSFNHNF